MIKNLHIKNLGPHKEVNIDFEPITCIVGKSYRGKSWTLRALRLAALNRPSGTRFIRWGATTAQVEIATKRHTVKRIRSKTKNKYVVDGMVLKAFGSKVPQAVQKALNLDTLNFQLQQEMPTGEGPLFWFALPPSQVSKKLNQIVNLDIIDRVLSNIHTVVYRAQSHLTESQDRLKTAKEKAKALEFVDDMVKEWNAILKLKTHQDVQQALVENLNELVTKANQETYLLLRLKSVIKEADKELQEIEELSVKTSKAKSQCSDIRGLLYQAEVIQTSLNNDHKYLRATQNELNSLMKNRCPLCGKKQ